jgi:hypothetical protein
MENLKHMVSTFMVVLASTLEDKKNPKNGGRLGTCYSLILPSYPKGSGTIDIFNETKG